MQRTMWVIIPIVAAALYLGLNLGVEDAPDIDGNYNTGDGFDLNEPAPPLSKNLNRFHDKRWHYQIDYPVDWTMSDYSTSAKMIRADIHRGDSVGIQIRVVHLGNDSLESFVDAYIQRFVDDMRGHWKGEVTDISRKFDWIGNYQGCCVDMVMVRGDGQRWLFKHYLWPTIDGSRRVVVFQCGTMVMDRDVNEPLLDAVAQSFRFL